MYKHILVCTDGSEVAQKGVAQGLSLAKSLSAKVTLIVATEKFPLEVSGLGAGWAPAQSTFDDFDKAQMDFAKKTLAAAKSEAEKIGVAADTVHAPNARPSEAILKSPHPTVVTLS